MNIKNLIERLRGIVKRNATEYISDRKEAADALKKLNKQLAEKEAENDDLVSKLASWQCVVGTVSEQLAAANAENVAAHKLQDEANGLLIEQARQLAEKDAEIEHLKQSRENFAAHAEKTLEQLAAAIAEIERLKSDALYYLTNEMALREKLAALQAVNQKLREVLGAVDDSGLLVGQYVIHERLNDLVKSAIYDTPNDTTALNEIIQRTAEKVKEMCALECNDLLYADNAQEAIRALDVSKIGEE